MFGEPEGPVAGAQLIRRHSLYDGKELAIMRGHRESDVVLNPRLREVKESLTYAWQRYETRWDDDLHQSPVRSSSDKPCLQCEFWLGRNGSNCPPPGSTRRLIANTICSLRRDFYCRASFA